MEEFGTLRRPTPDTPSIPTCSSCRAGSGCFRGVLVDAENPLRWETVPLFNVKECLISPDGKIAAMHDHCSAAGYSQSGLHWLVRLDHLEGIKFTGIDNRQVFLTASVDPDVVAQCPIALALWSGDEIFGPRV